MRPSLVAALTLMALLVFSLGAAASVEDRVARQAARDAELAAQLRARDAAAADAFVEANRLAEARDHARAIDAYARVQALVPGYAPAMRRQAVQLVEVGRRAEGIALARKTLKGEDSFENELALARALVTVGPETGRPSQIEVLEGVRHARSCVSRKPDDVDAHAVACEAALAAQDTAELGRCSAALVRLAPDEPGSHVYASIAALTRGEPGEARAALDEAKRRGLQGEIVGKLDLAIDEQTPFYAKWGPLFAKTLGGWLAGLGLLFLVGVVLSHATLRAARSLSPHDRVGARGAALRKVYRALLHVASLYYYVSLPLVLFVCVAIGGGLIYGFFAIGRIPVKLVVIIGGVVLFTIWSVLKSLLVRPKDEDPGTRIDVDEHPRLADVLAEVAARVGTRPVDSVYLTPHTDIAVLERGGFGKQLRGDTERCLVLGAGVLEGMKLAPFKAILAHEYGHFSNRDTAGGGFALAVRRSLLLTAISMAQSGAAGWYNPAWLFILGFHKIFLRISQGASRLQEVMADRWAAFSYGPEAFARGLKHVIRRSIEFDTHVQSTIHEVVEKERALTNLYLYAPEAKAESKEIDDAFDEALNREPSPYDSHPKPSDRIEWVRELATSAAPRPDDESDVWDLFEGRAALEKSMTDEVCAALLVSHGVVIARNEEAESKPEPEAGAA